MHQHPPQHTLQRTIPQRPPTTTTNNGTLSLLLHGDGELGREHSGRQALLDAVDEEERRANQRDAPLQSLVQAAHASVLFA